MTITMAGTHNILHPQYGVQCISTQEYAKVFPYIRLANVASPPMPSRLPDVTASTIPTLTAYQNISTLNNNSGYDDEYYFQKSLDPTYSTDAKNLQRYYDNLTWKTAMTLKDTSKYKDFESGSLFPSFQNLDSINNKNIEPYISEKQDNVKQNNDSSYPTLRSNYVDGGDTYREKYGTSSTSASFTYESSNHDTTSEDLSSFRYKNMGIKELNKVQKKVSSAIQYFMRNGEAKKTEDIVHSPKFNMYEPFSYPQLWRERGGSGGQITSKFSSAWLPDWIYLIYAVLVWLFITKGIRALQRTTYDTTQCTTSQVIRMWICFACVVVATNIAAIYCKKGGRKRQFPLMFLSTVIILLIVDPKPLLCHLEEKYILKYEAAVRSIVALFMLCVFIIIQIVRRRCVK